MKKKKLKEIKAGTVWDLFDHNENPQSHTIN